MTSSHRLSPKEVAALNSVGSIEQDELVLENPTNAGSPLPTASPAYLKNFWFSGWFKLWYSLLDSAYLKELSIAGRLLFIYALKCANEERNHGSTGQVTVRGVCANSGVDPRGGVPQFLKMRTLGLIALSDPSAPLRSKITINPSIFKITRPLTPEEIRSFRKMTTTNLLKSSGGYKSATPYVSMGKTPRGSDEVDELNLKTLKTKNGSGGEGQGTAPPEPVVTPEMEAAAEKIAERFRRESEFGGNGGRKTKPARRAIADFVAKLAASKRSEESAEEPE